MDASKVGHSPANLPSSPWNSQTRNLSAPLAVVDLDAFDANAADLRRRAGGTPIRVATKSVRVPELIRRALSNPGFAGTMTFTLGEAIWLVEQGITDDALMGYPTTDLSALERMAADPNLRDRITLMVDDTAHLNQLAALPRTGTQPFRVCLDVDASLRVGPVHIGVRRSPLRTPEETAALARAALERGVEVRGVMFYEAQVAGLGERGVRAPIIRMIKKLSLSELRERRQAVTDAVAQVVGKAILVNGGGSGSVAQTAAPAPVTEVTAGSGLFVPALFDHYSTFTPRPAAFFGLDVVRRPGPRFATVFGGGYIASGPTGADRAPMPLAGKYVGTEGAGEVQTPLRFDPRHTPEIGDRVWFRHAKAGELMEHFTHVHLVHSREDAGADAGQSSVRTYRGEGFPVG